MDTSKNYIKMCKKADEIQSHWEPQNGDYFHGTPEDFADEDLSKGVYRFFECDDEYYSIIPLSYDVKAKEFIDETDAVRLPSQDVLQNMLDFELPIDIIKEFSNWCSELKVAMLERLQTIEQLWLGFAMKKNYQKIWNGKDWETV
jgi:hypothetical protein